MVKKIRFLRKNSPLQISYVAIRNISTASHRSPPITNIISTQTMAPRRQAAKATLKATGGTPRRNDNDKGQHGDGRHGDGDGRHDDADGGNVQQDDRRHDDSDGRTWQ
jgi:hypothetical protein